jgi:hypothetical protein
LPDLKIFQVVNQFLFISSTKKWSKKLNLLGDAWDIHKLELNKELRVMPIIVWLGS